MNLYCVCWTHGKRFLIDFDDEAMACAFALLLAEAGRSEINVSKTPYEPDLDAAERIRERLRDRLGYEWAVGFA